MLNAIGYCRISNADQSHFSLENQERAVREYCNRHGVKLLAIFKDNGQSSYTFDRPDWLALEDFIKNNKNVEYLVVLDYDRFSRNIAEALIKIKELQDRFKIKVLATTDSFDTDFTDPNAFMIRAFKFIMAENELHNIRKRTKNGNLQAALNGRFINMAPYGYKNARDDRDKPILVIDDERAEHVRTIFRDFLAGMPMEEIRRRIGFAGYRQKSSSALRRVLTNCVYAGLIPIPAHADRKSKYAKGIHIPIIAEADYWLVQEKLLKKPKATHSREEIPLRGVLRCWCGRKMTAGNSRSHTGTYYWYYLCKEHRENLPAKAMHKQFGELLDHLSISEERIEWYREKILQDVASHNKTRTDEMARISRELKYIQVQLGRAEAKFLKGNVSEESFQQVMTELKADQARYQLELAHLNTDHSQQLARIDQLFSGLKHLRQTFMNMPIEKQHQFLNLGFDRQLWYENGIYRTQGLHPLLSGNELELKEKKLLVIEKPVKNIAELPSVHNMGARSNLLDQALELLTLIA